jgi:hypothetical protein
MKRANSQMQNIRDTSLDIGKAKSTLKLRQDWQSYIMNSSTHDVLKNLNIEKRPIHYHVLGKSPPKNNALRWEKKKHKMSLFDEDEVQAKKDAKKAPNHYFRIPKKGDQLSNK